MTAGDGQDPQVIHIFRQFLLKVFFLDNLKPVISLRKGLGIGDLPFIDNIQFIISFIRVFDRSFGTVRYGPNFTDQLFRIFYGLALPEQQEIGKHPDRNDTDNHKNRP